MKFKVALAQCAHPADGDVVAMVDGILERAAAEGAALVVFPESLMTPYELAPGDFAQAAEPLDGAFCTAVNGLAAAHGVWAVYTANERNPEGSRPFNTAVVVDDAGEVRGVYRKSHLFDTDATSESEKVMAGGALMEPIETPFGKLGLGICYDLRFPELARAAALEGCDVLAFPSAWVDGPGKVGQWKTLLAARAIENQVFVVGVSRPDRGFGADARDYAGHSCAFGPCGEELATASLGEALVIAEIDADSAARAREAMPVLEHRHVELYGKLLERPARTDGKAPAGFSAQR